MTQIYCDFISMQLISSEYTGLTEPIAELPTQAARMAGSVRDHFASSSLRALFSESTQVLMIFVRVAGSCWAAASRQAPAMSNFGGPADCARAATTSAKVATSRRAARYMGSSRLRVERT